MVDEFQDTNRLQCELIDLVAQPERQEVFTSATSSSRSTASATRTSRSSASGASRRRSCCALTRTTARARRCSRRSTTCSATRSATSFQPLAASAEFPDPVFGHPVELLVTDKASYADTRRALAHAARRGTIARRVRELVDTGEATPGEIVLLFAAGTDAEWYEEELRRVGLPTYRATGRGYFGQQQVVDLLALPAAAAQPLRRRGARDRARVAVRRRLERRARAHPPQRAAPAALHGARARRCRRPSPTSDERLLRAFQQRYERLVAASARRLARAAVRAGRRRARLRPRRARALGRRAPLREPAQARAARALVRGAARRATSRASSASSASRRRSARRSSRRSPRRRAPTPCGC